MWGLQDRGLAHNDICPANLGVSVDRGTGRRTYYLFDLGAASLLACPHSPFHGSRCAPADTAGHEAFMPLGRLLGDRPNRLSDMVSLVYTAITLAGCALPWEGGAAEHDFAAAVSGRVQLRGDSPLLQHLPAAVRAFASAVLTASGQGCSELGSAQQHWQDLGFSSWSQACTSSHVAPQDNMKPLQVLGMSQKMVSIDSRSDVPWMLPAVQLQNS